MSNNLNIIVLADIHDNCTIVHSLRTQIQAADLVILAGDMTTFGNESDVHDVIEALDVEHDKIIGVFGNMDPRAVIDYFETGNYSLHGKAKIVNGIGFFGLGGSNRTPMRTPTEFGEEQIKTILEQGYEQTRKADTTILVSHTPPYKVLDRALMFLHAGSKSLRGFIMKTKPLICLCGHIHEAHGIEMLDNTVVVNPGKAGAGYYAHVSIIMKNNIPDSIDIEINRFHPKKRQLFEVHRLKRDL